MDEPSTVSKAGPRGPFVIVVLVGALFWVSVVFWQVGFGGDSRAGAQTVGSSQSAETDGGAVPLEALAMIFRGSPAGSDALLDEVFAHWNLGYTAPLLELDRILGAPRTLRAQLMDRLAKAWGLDVDGGVRDQRDAIQQALWAATVEPLPGYGAWKADLYRRLDPRFESYFDDHTDSATIRLDEVQWGGVRRDGIPPLSDPETVAADAAEADYLGGSDVVFGVVVNGQARAYPKRILAWHEMVKDHLGGQSINGVYCTLCGSMIVYDTHIDGQHYELGTSGFLYRSNKLMYDHATESMWSTISGEPVIGPLVGKGLKLTPRTVVTTTWERWKALHPQTTVLTLDTGHQRDYGEGVAYNSYFSTDALMFKVPGADKRLKNKASVLALRFGSADALPAALSSAFLKSRPVYASEHGGQAYVVLTDMSGAHRVYDPKGVSFSQYDGDRTVMTQAGDSWTLTEEALVGPNGEQHERLPSHSAFWFGWHAAHPDTLLIDK